MSVPFRAQLVLMALGKYSYGDHVSDPQAFVLRVRSILHKRTVLDRLGDSLLKGAR